MDKYFPVFGIGKHFRKKTASKQEITILPNDIEFCIFLKKSFFSDFFSCRSIFCNVINVPSATKIRGID